MKIYVRILLCIVIVVAVAFGWALLAISALGISADIANVLAVFIGLTTGFLVTMKWLVPLMNERMQRKGGAAKPLGRL